MQRPSGPYLVERYAPRTVNRILAGFRGVMKTTWRLGFMDAETYQRAVDIDNVRGQALPRGRALEDGELVALFQCCAEDLSPAGRRDAAMLAVFFTTGMRRAELAGLDIGDFDPVDCSMTIRNGKRRTQRVVYLTDRACELLREWLLVRGAEPGPVFCPINQKGVTRAKRLGGESIRYIVQRRQKQAGVTEFSPHDARRTVLTNLLDKGVDLSTVQRVAGHADVSTTVRYDRRGEAAKRRAAQALQIP